MRGPTVRSVPPLLNLALVSLLWGGQGCGVAHEGSPAMGGETAEESPPPTAAGHPREEPAGRPPGQEADGYFEAQVFYATDRAPGATGSDAFTGERGTGEISYGQVLVSIPDSHERGEIEGPAWWRFWDRENPTEFVLVLGTTRFGNWEEFGDTIGAILEEAGRDDVLLFLHGYNTAFEDAARRTAQLAYDLAFPGVPMFYSWPSKGETAAYPADEATVQWSQPHFADFLRKIRTELGAANLHVIAHSMGNRLLTSALATLDPTTLPPTAADLRQIVLAAPDIDADVFLQLAGEFHGKAERVTLYASRNDRAIRASRRFHGAPRAGGSIVLADGVETIDASEVESGFLDHSYFGDSIVDDLFYLIRSGLPASHRFGLVRVDEGDRFYWRFVPGSHSP